MCRRRTLDHGVNATLKLTVTGQPTITQRIAIH
jgi:hypothetical protein